MVIQEFGAVALGEIVVGEKSTEGSTRPDTYFELTGIQMELGLRGAWDGCWGDGRRQWSSQTLSIALLLVSTVCVISCNRYGQSPQSSYERASGAFVSGELEDSKSEARKRYEELRSSAPHWAWKFRILEAKAALWQGLFRDVVTLLEPAPAEPPADLAIPTLTLLGVAHTHLQQFPDAGKSTAASV